MPTLSLWFLGPALSRPITWHFTASKIRHLSKPQLIKTATDFLQFSLLPSKPYRLIQILPSAPKKWFSPCALLSKLFHLFLDFF